ncbi:carboxypeptidase-like regulatory domain-containing protein [Hymenobacter latericus]|uniref:carboxypeptidase-like regulatory domain-containing protein n=1 Tax=Hymenobacter sp. YIM 151858-1 TaxID=2987688 RepID=UPI0022278C99|nr:carboxypeptidase-like regulatory domain-containing protein [Hymenobacter sp. YIM 151858-1]UYZ60553.1 carboxypeptidase-like regulatory domain-containing protein [Hymenobacter sp. YIM 151858-1]
MLLSMFNRALMGAGLLAASISQPAAANFSEAPSTHTGVQITGSFSGTLIDQYTGRPLNQATVALMRQDNEQLIAGAVTADNGEFRLDRAAFGRYMLHVEVAGYEPLHEEVIIAAGRDVVDLGSYGLIPLKAVAANSTPPKMTLVAQD